MSVLQIYMGLNMYVWYLVYVRLNIKLNTNLFPFSETSSLQKQ